jgi:hypothetical protein
MMFHKGASENTFNRMRDSVPIAPATYRPARKKTVIKENATTIANVTALRPVAMP